MMCSYATAMENKGIEKGMEKRTKNMPEYPVRKF